MRTPVASPRTLTLAVVAGAVAVSAAVPVNAATPMTKAQARAVATHINVRQSDFPGYTAHPYESSKDAKAIARKTAQCIGSAPVFAKVTSASYDNGNGAAFNSETEFVASRAAAKRDMARSTSAKARRCSEQALEDAAKQAGASTADVTLTPVSEAAVRGLDAISGVKITLTITAFGFHATLHGWAIGFSRGNAEVTLSEVGTPDLPESSLRPALAHLIARAKHQVPAKGLPVAD